MKKDKTNSNYGEQNWSLVFMETDFVIILYHRKRLVVQQP